MAASETSIEKIIGPTYIAASETSIEKLVGPTYIAASETSVEKIIGPKSAQRTGRCALNIPLIKRIFNPCCHLMINLYETRFEKRYTACRVLLNNIP